MEPSRLNKVLADLRPSVPLNQWMHINTSEPNAIERLETYGIRLYGSHIEYSHDFYVRTPAASPNHIVIQLFSTENCAFLIEEPGHYHASMIVIGPDNVFATCGTPNMPGAIELRAEMHGASNTIIFGEGSTSNGTRIVAQGSATVAIGADCMLSDGITIRSTDNHAMFDIATGQVLNPPADVLVGQHVWLCQEVLVLSGVSIGPGSIVGARALVTRDLPACVLAVGSPAAVVRSGVNWTRKIHPAESERLDALRTLLPRG